jgi:hypothetical protein
VQTDNAKTVPVKAVLVLAVIANLKFELRVVKLTALFNLKNDNTTYLGYLLTRCKTIYFIKNKR